MRTGISGKKTLSREVSKTACGVTAGCFLFCEISSGYPRRATTNSVGFRPFSWSHRHNFSRFASCKFVYVGPLPVGTSVLDCPFSCKEIISAKIRYDAIIIHNIVIGSIFYKMLPITIEKEAVHTASFIFIFLRDINTCRPYRRPCRLRASEVRAP